MKTFSEYIKENKDREYQAAAAAHADRISNNKTSDEEKTKLKEIQKIASKEIVFNGTEEGDNILRYVDLDASSQQIQFYGSEFGDINNWLFDFKNKYASNEEGTRGAGKKIDFKDIDRKTLKEIEKMYKDILRVKER